MHKHTLTELSAQLKSKKISAVELAQLYLQRITSSELNAFINVQPEFTLAQAKDADARIARGDVTDCAQRYFRYTQLDLDRGLQNAFRLHQPV
jgi:Asp-tRNA(Asn)/Glu-tRNA(Gln) amidotransferase A subunit family amidase